LTSFVLNSIVVGTPPRIVVFRDVTVVRGVADRTINELSSKIRVPSVPGGLCYDVNEHVMESDRMIAPPL